MQRTVTLENGQELNLECNAASPIIFKRLWGENIMTGFQTIKSKDTDDLLEFMEKVVYTFNKTAELGAKDALDFENKYDDYIDFLSKFEIFELVSDNVLDVIIEMWGANTKTESEPKNL